MNPAAGRVLLVAPTPPPYGGMALQAGLLARFMRRDGVSVVAFPSNFALPRWLDVPGLRTLLRAVWIWGKLWGAMRQVDVVHVLAASWLYFFLVVCPVITVGRLRGKRVVLNYRGGGAKTFFDRYAWAVRPFFRAASVISAPSNFLAELIGQYFQRPVAIVPNIVDFSIFHYRQRARVQPKLLVTRHLEKMYDIESVLRAFKMVQAQYPEATLWIAGSGGEAANLRSLAAELALKNVTFLGHVAQTELPSIYDQCDIFINASRVDNFPGALLEASAAGLLVVSTCAGGIPFVYEHRKNALLSEPGDWRSLAASVEEALASPALAAQLSIEGAALARQCDWVEVSQALYNVYGFSPEQFPARVATLV